MIDPFLLGSLVGLILVLVYAYFNRKRLFKNYEVEV